MQQSKLNRCTLHDFIDRQRDGIFPKNMISKKLMQNLNVKCKITNIWDKTQERERERDEERVRGKRAREIDEGREREAERRERE